MANRVEDKLIPSLYEEFLHERFVQLATVDHQSGGTNVAALSWVHAKDESTILFAVDHRSRIIQNIKKQPLCSLSIIASGSTFSISGKAQEAGQSSSDVPIGLSIIQLSIDEVRDVMFYGAKIVTEPAFAKTYDEEAARRLDEQVMEELRKY
ncbi:pyridoxamine 5'-phosphate oxidase family protein [Jeotgalibacillus aurantiacus]|uniref:pyridoxamine 5'-phosphate oxidase family protein n=1 Tax=Jeotgalibacillus aurantiacus TaxID=2763266 RepID=UPI001D0A3B8C|nr:pyridoxamine 5'-phosphate oxidase family protein [Jeotgalibacillus aurantiacus]